MQVLFLGCPRQVHADLQEEGGVLRIPQPCGPYTPDVLPSGGKRFNPWEINSEQQEEMIPLCFYQQIKGEVLFTPPPSPEKEKKTKTE